MGLSRHKSRQAEQLQIAQEPLALRPSQTTMPGKKIALIPGAGKTHNQSKKSKKKEEMDAANAAAAAGGGGDGAGKERKTKMAAKRDAKRRGAEQDASEQAKADAAGKE